MAETTMPAAEATVAVADTERNSYELAFHVLPTVAEGEVAGVFAALKDIITKAGGEIFDEEQPQRFDLAYEIVKHLEGKNRKFTSAYFGWIRFTSEATAVHAITEEFEHDKNVLRFLMIKLTKVEEQHPFRFHDALASQKMVTTVEESSVVPDLTTVTHDEDKTDDSESSEEESGEVDESALDEALNKEEA